MSYRYILRYLIDPFFDPEARLKELVAFCQSARIEEVMLFVTAEELSAGHPTSEELDHYIELGRAARHQLSQEGIALSLNPWSTIYHSARGRRLRGSQSFRLMVGENGVMSQISPCPLDHSWQQYLSDSFARLAGEIKPTALWIEDDWRLRNHDAALGWGGCFCEDHLARFSSKVGQSVTREELLEAILQPGSPHPWRSLWLDLSGETLLQPLRRVSEAIRTASPGTRVALMSGSPDAHAAEGRDWRLFQEAVGYAPTFLGRPTMKPYTQMNALETQPGMTRLAFANYEGEIEIYPELENSPRCGIYSKSQAYSRWQILNAAVMGSAGITINHYDMLGNGISLDEDYGRGLEELKPILNALKELGLDDRQADGVRILFHPHISRVRQTESATKGMVALSQNSAAWGDTCFILGIAHHYSKEAGESPAPTLVNQQTLRAFSDEEILRLLSGALILDAESVEILLERGFGELLGIGAQGRKTLAQAAYSYEQIEAERFGGPLRRPRMTAQRCSTWLLPLEPQAGAEILTGIYGPDHRRLWTASTLFRNSRGGRIVCLTYPIQGASQFFMAFFNVYRKAFLQRLLFEMSPSAYLACVANHPLQAYRTSGNFLAALNPTDDRVGHVDWLINRNDFVNGSWEHLERDGSWRETHPTREQCPLCDLLRFDIAVEPLHGSFFRFQKR